MSREMCVLVTCDRCSVEAFTDQGILAKDGTPDDRCGVAGHWFDGGRLPPGWAQRDVKGRLMDLCEECADSARAAAAP